MSNAEKKTNRDRDPERAEKFVAEHQLRYSDHIEMCRQAQGTTSTTAWQVNYEAQVKTHREEILRASTEIRQVLDKIKVAEPSDDDLKLIKEGVKAMAEECERFDAWRARAVMPYSRPVEVCKTILDRVIREAHQAQAENPLVQNGLVEEVVAITKRWPRAIWDEDAGTVQVIDKAA